MFYFYFFFARNEDGSDRHEKRPDRSDDNPRSLQDFLFFSFLFVLSLALYPKPKFGQKLKKKKERTWGRGPHVLGRPL